MICTHCGKSNRRGVTTCVYCHKPIKTYSLHDRKYENYHQHSWRNIVMVILIGAGLFIEG